METDALATEILEQSQLEDTFLSRIVKLDGFGGRTTGDLLAFNANGSFGGLLFGSIDEAVQAATGTDPNFSFEVSLGDRDAVAKGLACGGNAKVITQLIGEDVRVLLEAIANRRVVAAASLWSDGRLLFVNEFGEVLRKVGDITLSPSAEVAVIDRLSNLLSKRTNATVVENVDGFDIAFEVYAPRSKGVIIGSSKLAEAIVTQFKLIGADLTVVDTIEETLDSVRSLSTNDALIILSHDHEIGVPACDIALRIKGLYIGALGSRHTQHARRERLLEIGYSQSAVDTIYGPVGLNLGSKTPAETALAIAAEFLAHRSGRNPSSLRNSEGPING